jgi:serine/threonine protein kinase/MFS family permease
VGPSARGQTLAVDPEITAALPDYDVEREIGRGGMGVVFLGKHARLGRRVAIKELPPSFAADSGVRERFSTEARTLASLAHPHIVPIYDYVEREGLCLIVMEELPGGTVWDRFTSAGLTPPTACAIVIACCAALQHAHDEGVLHLDVKPDNLMFANNTAIKVTDFGISRVVSGDRTLGTLDGQVLGTPAYMSPEQARGDELTKASDVYSTGIMLYELLSGHLPWSGGETATDLLLKRLREAPTPLRNRAPHVPAALSDVVMKAIEREPADRYPSAEAFGIAIGSACADSWGPNWLDSAGVSIIGSERLSMAARTTRNQAPVRTTGPVTNVTGSPEVAPQTIIGDSGETEGGEKRAAQTIAAGAVAPVSGEVAPVAPAPQEFAPMEFEVVRAAGADRIQGANLNEIAASAFVDVSDVINEPVSTRVPAIIAALLLVAAVLGAVFLFEAPTYDAQVPRGSTVTIGGERLAAGKTVEIDTAENVPVVVTGALAQRSLKSELKFSVAGIPVGSATTNMAFGKGEFDTGAVRYLAAGNVKGTVTFSGKENQVGETEFAAKVKRPFFLTAMGVGGILILLAAFAYFESSIRPLRRGRRRVMAYIGCALSMAVGAAGIALLLASLGVANLTVPGLVVLAIGAGVAGGFLGEVVRRSSLRKGVRQAIKRAEKSFATP